MTPRLRIEDAIQRAVIQTRDLYSGQCPALKRLYAILNGGQRSLVEAAIMKGMGGRAGMPDLHLPVGRCHGMQDHLNGYLGRFHSLYIELKKPGGVLSEAQRAEIGALQQAGNCVQVCDSLDKAWAVLCWYLWPQWADAPRALNEVVRDGEHRHLYAEGRWVWSRWESIPADNTNHKTIPWFEGQTEEEAEEFLLFCRMGCST